MNQRGKRIKALVFGAGRFYANRKEALWERAEVTGFLDNAQALHGREIDGRRVFFPWEAAGLEWEYIVLMSVKTDEMYRQLTGLGIPEERILVYQDLLQGELQVFGKREPEGEGRKRVLLVTTALDYTGAPLAALYAARALKQAGYETVLAAEGYDENLLREALGWGLTVYICPAIPHLGEEELRWMGEFDLFLVNTFPMMEAACRLASLGPVLWWIHEPYEIYGPVMEKWENRRASQGLADLPMRVCAVSEIPQRRFNSYFPGVIRELLPYGIPDEAVREGERKAEGPMVFALVGFVTQRKAQECFVRAAHALEEAYGKRAVFLLIGHMGEDGYSQEVQRLCGGHPQIKICGTYTREQMAGAYPSIDAVVCPSIEDPLPIVMTEAMMWGKALIVSEETGTRRYIKDQWNGLVCRAGDPASLYEKMEWVMEHREELGPMGRRARKTYEENFSMEAFSKRLGEEMEKTEAAWERGRKG